MKITDFILRMKIHNFHLTTDFIVIHIRTFNTDNFVFGFRSQTEVFLLNQIYKVILAFRARKREMPSICVDLNTSTLYVCVTHTRYLAERFLVDLC